MTQSLALSSSTQNSEKLNQAGFNPPPPPELSFQFTYSSMASNPQLTSSLWRSWLYNHVGNLVFPLPPKKFIEYPPLRYCLS